MNRSLLTLAVAVLFAVSGIAAESDDRLVASFYPSTLLQDPTLRGTPPQEQSYRFTRADLDGKGTSDYIVAAYFNGAHDALRVLHIQNGQASVAFDLDLDYIGGAQAEVTAVDLDLKQAIFDY